MFRLQSPSFKSTNQSFDHISIVRGLLLHRVSKLILVLSIFFYILLQCTLWSDAQLRKSLNVNIVKTATSTPKQNKEGVSTFSKLDMNGTRQKQVEKTLRTSDLLSNDQFKIENVSLFTKQKLSLRFDWTNMTLTSDLSRRFQQLQYNCSLPMASITKRHYGLGSDLHMYGRALCNALQFGAHRVRTVPDWTWMDHTQCQNNVLGSPMRCYFAQSELNCPGDVAWAIENPDFNPEKSISNQKGVVHWNCSSLVGPPDRINEDLVQRSTVEFLFTHVTSLLYEEATRQLNLVFGDVLPKDLITVHIRWGDKVSTYKGKKVIRPEMRKAGVNEYIDAVNNILLRRHGGGIGGTQLQKNFTADVFLATEDPAAVQAFRAAMPKEWNLFIDHSLTEIKPYRVDGYNGHSATSQMMGGRPGLLALASLLVAMEANDFVLTTQSNWSRLMDELRLAIVNPRCGNCTTMVDLRKQ